MADSTFNYQFEADSKVAPCPIKDESIHCDIKSLSLLQGTSYDAKLVRLFDDEKISTLVSEKINTLTATTVVGSSVSQNQIVYDKPKTFTFDFDKNVVKSDLILEKVVSDKRTVVATTTVYAGKRATVTVTDDLERDTPYQFSIDKLEAQDGSTLPEPYKLNFVTSDGPTVAAVNVDSTGLPFSGTIVLTFDQGLSVSQSITDFVNVTGVSASIRESGNQVFIDYSNASVCNAMNIKVNPGLISDNGVIQNDSWQFSTRTICYTTLVIGNSVRGRPILAYIFGSGGTTILFTGGIHGNEPSGSYIMHDWISYLDSNAEKIPTDKKIVVVPDVNPDGLATNSRYNSNNVNIDRNFPSSDWKADIDSSSGTVVGGGGSSAMSEPETKALANLTTTLQPRLEVSFHAQGSLMGANQRGDSVSIGNQYALSVGYSSMVGHAEETMGYSITGEYEEWAGEQYGTPAILIELPSSTGRYFWSNQPALLDIIDI
jgi:protein MpaA